MAIHTDTPEATKLRKSKLLVRFKMNLKYKKSLSFRSILIIFIINVASAIMISTSPLHADNINYKDSICTVDNKNLGQDFDSFSNNNVGLDASALMIGSSIDVFGFVNPITMGWALNYISNITYSEDLNSNERSLLMGAALGILRDGIKHQSNESDSSTEGGRRLEGLSILFDAASSKSLKKMDILGSKSTAQLSCIIMCFNINHDSTMLISTDRYKQCVKMRSK